MDATKPVSLWATEKSSLRIRDCIQIVIATVLVALFLRGCVVEAFRIPSGSMEHTLSPGDFLLANKFIYGVQTQIPFTNYKLDRFRFPAFTSPERGDVVVFKLPDYARESNSTETYAFVKRCIGLPGDSVSIVNRRVIINGESVALPPFASSGSRPIFPKGLADSRIFPKGSTFNEDNYGPLAVPASGDTLRLDVRGFLFAKNIIEHEGHVIQLDEAGRNWIDGTPRDFYVVEKNYYFMLGDNRDNSFDSRFWGFVPEDLIIGKPMIIYWSWDEEKTGESFWSRLVHARWERIGTIVR